MSRARTCPNPSQPEVSFFLAFGEFNEQYSGLRDTENLGKQRNVALGYSGGLRIIYKSEDSQQASLLPSQASTQNIYPFPESLWQQIGRSFHGEMK